MTAKKTAILLIVTCSLCMTGCGDSYRTIMLEEMALGNEVADLMIKVVDEPSAKFFTDIEIKKLKLKFDDLEFRKERYVGNVGLDEFGKMIESYQRALLDGGASLGQEKSKRFTGGLFSGQVSAAGGIVILNAKVEGKLYYDLLALQSGDHIKEYEAIKLRAFEQRRRIKLILDNLAREEGKDPKSYPNLYGFVNEDESNLFTSTVGRDFGKTFTLENVPIDSVKLKENEGAMYTILVSVALVLLLVGLIVYNLLKKMRII